ncbi:isoquinoline 1-oxidoreductase beta subunit [Nocardioides ginsengisegetis]|uniref:Isoquinoline 1-oxidoreductase beta subunit n=1 Tax=Nocardioides ginsengisegetis TaxID=661491 RepID=A0A7W3IW57_9ACTN|nr:molybdopterin cofactor-binding domain-containing protein [Nocardioides ginsengisegetis]MBA8801741.1 isoquinoline 1-oxidoreductase beta subunit [Nocardioides ginsengisegetis]
MTVDARARTDQPDGPATDLEEDAHRISVRRRSFLGYVLGGATLVAAADLGLVDAAAAAPTAPQPAELYDLNDMLTDSCRPTANLITVTVHDDGTASFALPRMEVGQGITTSSAMLIAEELELPVSKVKVTLAPARPELQFNQLTGGSNTTISTYTPIRVAAAVAKGALMDAAAIVLGDTVANLHARNGVVHAPDGSSVTYAELASKAASPTTRAVGVQLKDTSEFRVIGVGQGRVDALDAVTGRKEFTTDKQVKGALPTMVCRAPTLNGTPKRLTNKAEIARMPGVRDLAKVDTGIAVRADTFGQCIDAIRAMKVEWNDGPVAGESDEDIVHELKAAELALPAPPDNPLAETLEADFLFYFRSNSAMDTNSAIADVRADRATIWAGLKSPITAQQRIAEALGMTQDQVTVNVVTAGGSFGRRLFFDGALEAAKISQAMGKPVKLMWHRADDARVGRGHPMSTNRVRITHAGDEVLAFQQTHTSVETDYRHGLGEIISAMAADLPAGYGNLGYAETIFSLTQEVPYDFGVVSQTLTETDDRFNTGSMRNIYSPDVRCASELVVDQLAKKLKKDPYEFRRSHLRNDRVAAVLDKVAKVGDWGRSMPAGTAQGIAIHKEYKGASACLVEIDCRPATVDRDVPDATTGPRVTRVVFAIDAGLVINPRGMEAQMQGGINDGIALALTSSLHLRDGHFLEASWDNYFYTRQWNTPPEVKVILMPSDSGQPGGAGEAGVAASFAAVACAFARATGELPTYFPINHRDPLRFRPKPVVPPIPQSPTNGLKKTY